MSPPRSAPRRMPRQAARMPGSEPQRTVPARSAQELLARHVPGRADPLHVLEVLLQHFNTQHTARHKSVSHKTRHERARYLRQFFHDLQAKAGFRTMPDPRNLGQKHLQAMVQIWQRERLAPATVQTYLSFLRGLAGWLGKPGMVRKPAHYGMRAQEYQRHEVAQSDKSWSAHGVDIDAVLAQVTPFDARVAASLRLMDALGLRQKEAVMFRPHAHVLPFAQTGLPPEQRKADDYAWIKGKGGRVRWIALETPAQRAAVQCARAVVDGREAHMGHPDRGLDRNLRRLNYVLEKFGITKRLAGVSSHGLRHGNANDLYEAVAGQPSPVRGGGHVPEALDRIARRAVAERAGHVRLRASAPYIGSARSSRAQPAARRPDDLPR
ncbi:MAG TPA: phage integrase N-terminal domain-containing protein [Pseudorhodoferax sp.]|nr:phage integrase N-terminal domain-containing protein [Pseudorhodoferax sp.]